MKKIYAVVGYENGTNAIIMQKFFTTKKRAELSFLEWTTKRFQEHYIDYFKLEEYELNVD